MDLDGIKCDWMMTDLLIFSVFQLQRMVSHTQQRDNEVNQSQDAVQPQKAVPSRNINRAITDLPRFARGSGMLHEI